MGGTLMISGNMRVLARTSASASSVNFNSSNMNGCTIFCIQYTYYCGGSPTGGSQNMQVTLNGDGSNYLQGRHMFNYNDSSGSSTNLWWDVDESASGYILGAATGQPNAADGVSGELWVKSNMRDSSWAMMYQRNVCWDTNNNLSANGGTISWSGSSGGNQITSILFTAASATIIGFNAILWGGVD
jgi:hypothetical protein